MCKGSLRKEKEKKSCLPLVPPSLPPLPGALHIVFTPITILEARDKTHNIRKRKTFGVMEKTLLMVFWKKKPDIFLLWKKNHCMTPNS
jgi:hypothetical protein